VIAFGQAERLRFETLFAAHLVDQQFKRNCPQPGSGGMIVVRENPNPQTRPWLAGHDGPRGADDPGIDLKELLAIVRRRRTLVLAISGTVILLVLRYIESVQRYKFQHNTITAPNELVPLSTNEALVGLRELERRARWTALLMRASDRSRGTP
jgi:hypothetical protein